MSRSVRLLALAVAVLLLHSPAGFACEASREQGAEAMAPDCPMAGMPGTDHAQMVGMGHAPRPESPTNDSKCGNCGSLADECCDVKSAPEPVQTPSADGSQGPSFVELPKQQSPSRQVLVEGSFANGRDTGPPDLLDLERYVLNSAYLL